jgi:hypothetical protein
MTAKEKAIELVDKNRMILMQEDTDCGHEILCTVIAKRFALIAVDELIETFSRFNGMYDQEVFDLELLFWQEVKSEIQKL